MLIRISLDRVCNIVTVLTLIVWKIVDHIHILTPDTFSLSVLHISIFLPVVLCMFIKCVIFLK